MMDEHPLEVFRIAEGKRRGKPLPRYALAEELGFSKSRYTQIVKDRKPPSAALQKRIKERTGISADELLEAAE